MVQIKNPFQYVNEPDSLKKAGEYIKAFGKKSVLVIAGLNTRLAIDNTLHSSLESNQIEFIDEIFAGYPTPEKAEKYAQLAADNDVELLVAAGGGRAMDIAKAAGDIADIPVFTIPTVLGTCAAWAACSVLYNDHGDYVQCRYNRCAPIFVLADTRVLVNSPVRYLKSGIADTYAKWYELAPAIAGLQKKNNSRIITFFAAEMALKTLVQNSKYAVEALERREINQELYKVIDSIIYLAGFVGSLSEDESYVAFAHQFYNSVRGISASQKRLHGEIVAFGLLVQMILNEDMLFNIKQLVTYLDQIDNLFSLDDLGLADKADQLFVAERIVRDYEASTIRSEKHLPSAIIEAMQAADRYARRRQCD